MKILSIRPSLPELMSLYDSCGWTAYTREPERLYRAVTKSLYVFTAWEDERLRGLIRAVGDGETILYIQDLLVHPDSRRQGIASALMTHLLDHAAHVRQVVLLTDEASPACEFYERLEFHRAEDCSCVSYVRMR